MVDQLHQALAQLGRPADQAELEHLLHAPDLLGALNDLTEAGRARRTDRDGLVPVWEVTP